MVAFSRITLALAIAGLSAAQSFSGHPPAPTGDLPTGAFPSGAAHPTGGFYGGHGHHDGGRNHGGDHSGFAHPTGSFGPRPSDADMFDAQRAYETGAAPFSTGGDHSAFPSGAAKPSGHHGHHGKGGKGGKGGKHSGHASGGAAPTIAPSASSGLARRHRSSGSEPSGPKPTGPIPSGIAPPNGSRPSGHPQSPKHSGAPPARPSGVEDPAAAAGSSSAPKFGAHGPHPTGARPSGRPVGPAPSGVRPTGPPPSGKPSGPAPTSFVTSTVRGA